MRTYVQQTAPEQLVEEMGLGAAAIGEIITEIRSKLPGAETPPALEPDAARFRLFDSITIFLKNVAQRQPLMVVLDDHEGPTVRPCYFWSSWLERLEPARYRLLAPTGISRFPGAIPCPRPLALWSGSNCSTECSLMD